MANRIGCAVIAMIATLSLAHTVYAVCLETGPDGRLRKGRMPRGLFTEFIIQLSQESPKTQFFKVQNQQGFYGKLCDQEEQKINFYEHFGMIGITPNCETICQSSTNMIDNYYDRDGIWRFDETGRDPTCWEICFY